MTQLYIPELGDTILLKEDWEFALYNESRNATIMAHFGDPRDLTWSWDRQSKMLPEQRVIPAGQRLKIDRIYIRKGQAEFSSVSFLWVGVRVPGYSKMEERSEWIGNKRTIVKREKKYPARPVRFWAKLSDVNKIVFENVV